MTTVEMAGYQLREIDRQAILSQAPNPYKKISDTAEIERQRRGFIAKNGCALGTMAYSDIKEKLND